jgi:hypothetical protein
VDLLLGAAFSHDLPEEADELLAAVAHGGSTHHFAGLGVQRRIERQGAVAIVFEAVAFGAAGSAPSTLRTSRRESIKPPFACSIAPTAKGEPPTREGSPFFRAQEGVLCPDGGARARGPKPVEARGRLGRFGGRKSAYVGAWWQAEG